MESRILCQKAFNKTYGFIARFPLARPQIHLSVSLELNRKFRLPFFPTNQECLSLKIRVTCKSPVKQHFFSHEDENKKVRLRSVCLPYGITQCSSFLSQGFSVPQKRLKQLKARKFMHTSITQDNTL